MIASICIISLLLESIISNFFSTLNSIFIPLFCIVALIILFPYFTRVSSYLIICFIYGLFYDILFSNFLFLNAFLFFLIGMIMTVLYHIWSEHIISILLFTFLSIIIYKIFYTFLLSIILKIQWDSIICFKTIASSLILNFIYAFLLYFVTEFFQKKWKIYKID